MPKVKFDFISCLIFLSYLLLKELSKEIVVVKGNLLVFPLSIVTICTLHLCFSFSYSQTKYSSEQKHISENMAKEFIEILLADVIQRFLALW